jgi:hypothetical protein
MQWPSKVGKVGNESQSREEQALFRADVQADVSTTSATVGTNPQNKEAT